VPAVALVPALPVAELPPLPEGWTSSEGAHAPSTTSASRDETVTEARVIDTTSAGELGLWVLSPLGALSAAHDQKKSGLHRARKNLVSTRKK
jgi:hypothetical protein